MASATPDRGIGSVEPLWYPREAACYLSVSQATLSRWRREGVGPPFLQVRAVYRYAPAAVRAWVHEQANGDG